MSRNHKIIWLGYYIYKDYSSINTRYFFFLLSNIPEVSSIQVRLTSSIYGHTNRCLRHEKRYWNLHYQCCPLTGLYDIASRLGGVILECFSCGGMLFSSVSKDKGCTASWIQTNQHDHYHGNDCRKYLNVQLLGQFRNQHNSHPMCHFVSYTRNRRFWLQSIQPTKLSNQL